MTKPVIVTRLGKGAELTFQEGDDNFTNLRDATINVSADSGSTQNIDLNGTVTVAGGTGINTSANNGVITVNGFDGDYDSLSNKPALFDGAYSSLSGTPTLATVATSGAYSDLSGTPTIPTNNNQLTNGAGYITGIDSGAVTTALGFTPENAANKNAVNGYAGLDATGKVAAAQLPSYVDDVIESASFASLPATGETGKIYITLDTNKVYRWSGSAYVEIVASPGSTDEVTEGATNLYFTQQRARDSFSAGANISLTNGEIAVTGSLGMSDIVEDTTPQLGGDLDANGFGILDNETGSVNIGGFAYPNVYQFGQTGTSSSFQGQGYLNLNDTGNNLSMGNQSLIKFSGTDIGEFDGTSNIGLQADVVYYVTFPFGTSFQPIALWQDKARTIQVLNAPDTQYNLTDLQWQEVIETVPSMNQILNWNGTQFAFTDLTGISSVSEDTTPQLGGDLDVNGNSIVDRVNGTINIGGFAYPNNVTELQSGTVVGINAQDRLTLNDTGANLGLANNDTLQFTGSDVGQFDGSSPNGLEEGVTYYINFPFGTSAAHISLATHPQGDPNRQTVLTNMNTGYTITDLQWQQVQEVVPGNSQVLAWNGTQLEFADQPAAGITTVVEDTAPQLGGNLDVNGNSIVSTSDGNIVLAPNGTGRVSLDGVLWPAADGTNGQVLSTNGSGSASWATPAGGGASFAIVRITSAKGTQISGDLWRSNITEELDSGNIISISSNQFNLPAGTYVSQYNGSMLSTNSSFSLVIRNVTDNVDLIDAVGSYNLVATGTRQFLPTFSIPFTLAATKNIEFRVNSSGNISTGSKSSITLIKVA